MNTSRSTHFGLCSLVLILPLGCATGGSQHRISQTRPSSSPQTVVRHDSTAKSDSDNSDTAAEATTDIKPSEGWSDKLTPVAYVDLSTKSAVSQPLAMDESVVGDDLLEPVPTTGTTEYTLASLEQIAMENNPAIRQASATASEAAGIRTQVGLRPNPTVGYFGSQLGDAGTEQNGAFISQDFVLGGKLALNRNVLNEDVQALLWDVEAQRFRVRTDIRTRFYEALAAQRRLELSSSFREVARKGVRVAEERMAALEGARPDILQSEIQLNEVDLIAQQARIDFDAAWRELAAIAGVPHMTPPRLVGSLEGAAQPHDLETEFSQLLGCSPELQAARSRVERARANLARQQVQPIPNLQTQLQFGHDNATGSQLTNIQVGVPLPIHNKNQGNICAAQAEYARATQDVHRLELELRARLTRAMRNYDVAHITVDRYENQILPMADENLQLSEEAHAAGEFDFLRVLVARRTFFDANLNYVRALADLAQADAMIEGLQLSGGLTDTRDFAGGDDLRGQALSGQ